MILEVFCIMKNQKEFTRGETFMSKPSSRTNVNIFFKSFSSFLQFSESQEEFNSYSIRNLQVFFFLLQICVVIAAVFGIVIYRVVTVSTFAAFKWALIRNNSQVATTGTAVCINFCIIMLLNVVSKTNVSKVSHQTG